MTEQKQTKQMTLKQCGQYDKQSDAKNRLTGWGRVCRDRCARGVSRRLRILAKKGMK